MRQHTRPLPALLSFILGACASSGAAPVPAAAPGSAPVAAAVAKTSGDSAATNKSARRGSANVISLNEIEAAPSDVVTAYDLVARLRPTMMRRRMVPSLQGSRGVTYADVIAFADDIKLGPVEMLQSLKRENIKEIRYITAVDATNRWGPGLTGGVVQVITTRLDRK